MTPERLQEIKVRCELATPGPWKVKRGGIEDYCCNHICADFSIISHGDFENRNFIANAREDVSALIEALEEANKRIEELNEEVKIVSNDYFDIGDKLGKMTAERDDLKAKWERCPQCGDLNACAAMTADIIEADTNNNLARQIIDELKAELGECKVRAEKAEAERDEWQSLCQEYDKKYESEKFNREKAEMDIST